MNIERIATALIDEDRAQPRYQFDEEALQELMDSIKELGLLSPIKVRKAGGGRYTIIYGNRRYKACKMLQLETIPCIISTADNETDIYLEQIAENLTREDFSPIEEAEAFDKLLHDPRFSHSVKFLASKLGKPESYIKNKCELLKFGQEVRKLIVSGTVIKAGKLTEEQLMPIKDLAIEHRDPFALIIARDEMPVSDVKKIARLFKDDQISPSTKDKLLYKSGPSLLETWSMVQQSKAERAKQAEARAIAVEKEKEKEKAKEKVKANIDGKTAGMESGTESVSDHLSAPYARLEGELRHLLDALQTCRAWSAEEVDALHNIEADRLGQMREQIDLVIGKLEQHLQTWHHTKKQLSLKTPESSG